MEPKTTKELATQTALEMARDMGCDCNVDTVTSQKSELVWYCEVLHDEWCTLIKNQLSSDDS